MGEDVGRYGGCYAVSKGLLEEFGLSGSATRHSPNRLSWARDRRGPRRHATHRRDDDCNFSLLALDQIVNNAATLLHMSGGQFSVPW